MRRMSSRFKKALEHYPITSWSEKVLKAQWKYVARLKTLPTSSWQVQVSRWKIAEINDESCLYECRRNPGHPLCRISKFSRTYLGSDWYDVAMPRFLHGMTQFLTMGP